MVSAAARACNPPWPNVGIRRDDPDGSFLSATKSCASLVVSAGPTLGDHFEQTRCGHSSSGVRNARNNAALHKAEIAVASHKAAEIE